MSWQPVTIPSIIPAVPVDFPASLEKADDDGKLLLRCRNFALGGGGGGGGGGRALRSSANDAEAALCDDEPVA
jgi:hypothetical protein